MNLLSYGSNETIIGTVQKEIFGFLWNRDRTVSGFPVPTLEINYKFTRDNYGSYHICMDSSLSLFSIETNGISIEVLCREISKS